MQRERAHSFLVLAGDALRLGSVASAVGIVVGFAFCQLLRTEDPIVAPNRTLLLCWLVTGAVLLFVCFLADYWR